MEIAEGKEIVIVGGGICGLATALALHRKGISSVVLEKSDRLRATGAVIIIQANGWRALDQLGVASKLRQTAIPIRSGTYISLNNGQRKEIPLGNGELRCLKRSDLINTMADHFPRENIRFGCQMISIKLDPITSILVLQLHDGSLLKTKVVIGCEGANSLTAKFVGLNSTKLSSTCIVRGLTRYERSHGFGNEYVVMRRDHLRLGRTPVNDKLVYWFLTRKWTAQDWMVLKDRMLIRSSTMESIRGFPAEIVEMIKNSDLHSLHLAPFRYQAPWELLRGSFRKGTVTVAGDAMHAMGPFLAQGGSASLEDAIVLASCLAQNMRGVSPKMRAMRKMMVEKALDQYVKERRMRVVRLSMQAYLTGLMLHSTSIFVKFTSIVLITVLFPDPLAHTYYDCGRL